MNHFPRISLQQWSKNITPTDPARFPRQPQVWISCRKSKRSKERKEISGIPAPINSIRCYSFSDGLSCAHFSIWKGSVLLVFILILGQNTRHSNQWWWNWWPGPGRGKPASTLRVPEIYVEKCPGRERYEGGDRRECHRIFGQQSKILWHNSTQTNSQPINTAAWISKSMLTVVY